MQYKNHFSKEGNSTREKKRNKKKIEFRRLLYVAVCVSSLYFIMILDLGFSLGFMNMTFACLHLMIMGICNFIYTIIVY